MDVLKLCIPTTKWLVKHLGAKFLDASIALAIDSSSGRDKTRFGALPENERSQPGQSLCGCPRVVEHFGFRKSPACRIVEHYQIPVAFPNGGRSRLSRAVQTIQHAAGSPAAMQRTLAQRKLIGFQIFALAQYLNNVATGGIFTYLSVRT